MLETLLNRVSGKAVSDDVIVPSHEMHVEVILLNLGGPPLETLVGILHVAEKNKWIVIRIYEG